MKKRIISIVLSIVMLVSLLPTAAFAAGTDTGKAIQLVDSGTAANIGGGQADSIYFGTYKQSSDRNSGYNVDPIKWRVLSNADGKLFLLSNQNLDVFEYHKEKKSVTWETSTMRSWLNGYVASSNTGGDSGVDYTNDNFLDTAFSAEEQTAIADTKVVNDDNDSVDGGNDTTDKVFLLSIAEAKNTSYFADDNSRIATNTAYVAGGGEIGTSGMNSVGRDDYWWLRSPGKDDHCAAYVEFLGSVHSNGPLVNYAYCAVRPAFNLNLESVLFTSAAIGGKADTSVDGSLTEVGTAGTVWKLTLLDTNRSFSVSEQSLTGAPGGTVSISYSGAETGNNEYVSVMLAQGDTILYYGRIAQNSASGTAGVTIPSGLADGTYTLKVFSEQYNGDKRTDYASAFEDISLTVSNNPTETHSHPVCGATHSDIGDHTGTCEAVEWTAWDGTTDITYTDGTAYVYLSADVSLSGTLVVGANQTLYLCLNDHVLDYNGNSASDAITVRDGGVLYLTDCCTAPTTRYGQWNEANTVYTISTSQPDGGSFDTLTGGVITGGGYSANLSSQTYYGGGVWVYNGTFYMYGGTIAGNTAFGTGGGVQVDDAADGEYGIFYMYDGTITGNRAANGGGIGVFEGTFSMYGGTIAGNTATGSTGGGGVYVSESEFYMSGGSITDNRAAANGGGVVLSYSNKSKFNMSGGSITGNSADKNGGGVYAPSSAYITVSGAPKIINNTKGTGDSAPANNLVPESYLRFTVSGTLGTGASIGIFRTAAGRFSAGGADSVSYFSSDNAGYKVATDGSNLKLVALHVHNYTYSATGNIITESCTCGHEETATVSGPTGTIVYDGTEKKGATVSYSTGWLGGTLTVTYQNNINAGQATASITKAGATASVKFTINKAEPVYTPPTGVTATYGDTLANVNISAWGSGWSWKEPTTSVGNVGKKTFVAVFTPTDTNNYNTVDVNVSVTVNAKQLTNPTLTLSQDSFTYDGSAKTPVVTVKDGGTVLTKETDYTVSYSDNTNAGTGKVTVTFKGNYSGSAETTFEIEKANSSYTERPVAKKDLVYNSSEQPLVNAGSSSTGEVQYALGTNGSSAPTSGWSTSVPRGQNAGTYYVWYKVIGDSNHNNVAPTCVVVTIKKQQIAKPAADATKFIYNGESQTYNVEKSTLYEVSNEAQTYAGSYNVIVALKNTANYEWTDGTTAVLEYTFKIEQKELGIAWSNTTLTYNGAAQQPTATATGVVAGEQIALVLGAPATNAGSYTATVHSIDGATAQNYKLPTAVTTQFTIAKATPTYTVPANLTATYGQTLANVSLPNGWSWVNDSQGVGAVGTKSFDATFTPSDTVNYKTVEVKLTVTVGKATPVVAAPAAQNSIIYGAKLSEVGLTDGWTWVDGNTVPTVQNSGYVAYYTPADTDNFDWTGIYGWSTTNNRVERKVSVTVAKADAFCIAPVAVADLVYTGSAQNLVTAATPTGGTVQYSLSATGTFSDRIPTGTDAGTYDVYYKVIGDANHNDTDVLGYVQVKIAKQKVTMPTENTATFTYTGTAQTYMGTASNLYGISNKTQIDAGSYTVIVALKDSANYEWADGSTDNLTFTFTIAPKAVTVKADAKSMVYGASEPALTYVATGLVAGETLNGEITRAAGTDVGTYAITQGTVTDENNPNYTITFVGADFTITKADASCIAPVAVADLVYTGSAQTLVTAATPTGGTVQYSLSATGTFSDRIPTGTDAGTYDVYYKVIGDVNHNDTAVLDPVQVTISKANQDAPVVGKVDETIFGKNDGKITGVTSAMEYRKDGTNTYTDIVGVEIAGLADGTYYVRLKGDSNHNPSSDTEVVVAAGRYLEVTFNSNGGSDIDSITGLTYNTVITAPTAPTKENATFAGWFSDEACTKAWNFAKDTATADLTLYAKWSDVPVFHISGKVLEKTGDGENDTRGVPNANVKLMLGTTVVAEQITEADGTFYFGGQIAGDYNVVVKYRAPNSEHDKVVTALVEVHGNDADGIIVTLPQTVTNSIVEHEPAADGKDSIAAGTLVGNLDKVAAAVRDDYPSAQKVEVKLTVKDTPPVTNPTTEEEKKVQKEQVAIQQKSGGKQLVFFDLSVVKTIDNDEPEAITDTGDTLLEIRIPFDSGNKWGITIYRYHGDKAEVLAAVREGSTTEGFWVGDDGYIHIYTKKFSTYAVGYTVPSYGYFVPITPDAVTSADTFDAGIVVYVTMSMLAATGSAVVIGKKRKEEN